MSSRTQNDGGANDHSFEGNSGGNKINYYSTFGDYKINIDIQDFSPPDPHITHMTLMSD
jgi:hypothetical protein